MPLYLVTDQKDGSRVMVEAARPATAVAVLVNNRFDVSAALEAGDAVRLMCTGVDFLEAGDEPAEKARAGAPTEEDAVTAGVVADADRPVMRFDETGALLGGEPASEEDAVEEYFATGLDDPRVSPDDDQDVDPSETYEALR